MSRFGAIKSNGSKPAAPAIEVEGAVSSTASGRAGKKAISGYFSPAVSKALHLLALETDTSLQALMGEAFDDLMRKYGKHPFGER